MKRFFIVAACASLLTFALQGTSGAAAPATQPSGSSSLDEQNRALRDALADMTVKNRALDAENSRLRDQIKSLQQKLARTPSPQLPQPYRFEMPNPLRPRQLLPSPSPKNWIPKKDGDVDFYIIPIRNKPE